MKPYYEHGGITIYHADCREVLPTLPKVDLVITDPPYGMRWQSNYRQVQFNPIANDDSVDSAIEGVRLALGALKPGRHVYVFGKFDLSPLPIQSTVELIWNKGNAGIGDLSLPWGSQHETITFAVYRPSQKHIEGGKGRLSARLRRGSILSVPRVNGYGKETHPTEKPTLLIRQLIESSSVIGEKLLDPFCGTGSTLLAAKIEGRRAIGIEVEEKYCEIAAKRLSQEVLDFSEATA